MIAYRQNITMYQGETYMARVVVYDDQGQPAPLTGYNARYEAQTPVPIVKDSDDGAIDLTDAATGVLVFVLQPEDTAQFTLCGSAAYPHELRVQAPDGSVTVVSRGQLVVIESIIKDMNP